MSNFKMPFGKYKGTLITRVPPGYLRWMISTESPFAEHARNEIHRRGTIEPSIEVTSHAIDRASLRIMDRYLSDRKENEGLASWIARTCETALDSIEGGTLTENMRIDFDGITWVFDMKYSVPVLKSVWPSSQQEEIIKEI